MYFLLAKKFHICVNNLEKCFSQSDLLNKNTSCGYDHDHYDEKQAFLKNAAGSVDAITLNRIDGSEFNRILRVSFFCSVHILIASFI